MSGGHISAREAHQKLSAALGCDAQGILTDRLRVGMVRARATTLIVNHGPATRDAPIDLDGVINSTSVFQWRWPTSDLRILNSHWQAGGQFLVLEAFGVTFERGQVLSIAPDIVDALPEVTGDHLPDKFEAMKPVLARQIGCAQWWSWLEALSWVKTRNIERLAAQEAYREFIRSQGQSIEDDDALAIALRGVGDRAQRAEDDLIVALIGEKVRSQGEDGHGVNAIPAAKWREGKVWYDRGVHLGPKSSFGAMWYTGLSFSREDLQREFLGDGGQIVAPAPPSPSGLGRRKGVGGYAKNDQPLVDEMRILIESDGLSAWAAAGRVAPKAIGGGDETSKQRRLHDRYVDRFGPN